MYPLYADLADVPETTEDREARLQAASLIIRAATASCRYAVDADGYPTDPALKDAMKAATLAQVAYWQDNGVELSAGSQGAYGALRGVSLLSARLDAVDGSKAADAAVSSLSAPAGQAALLVAAIVSTWGAQPWELR